MIGYIKSNLIFQSWFFRNLNVTDVRETYGNTAAAEYEEWLESNDYDV